MARIFVSYAREDKPAVTAFVNGIQEAGHHVWWDRELGGGEVFRETIERELRAADVLIVVWSRRAKASRWVHDEAEFAVERGVLLPVRIDKTRLPMGFGGFNVLDFVDGNTDLGAQAWRTLLESIDRIAKSPTVPVRRSPLRVLPQALGLATVWGSVLGSALWLLHLLRPLGPTGSLLGHPLIDFIATSWIGCLPIAAWSSIEVRRAGFESAKAISRRILAWFVVGAGVAMLVLIAAVSAGAVQATSPRARLVELSRVFLFAAMGSAFVVTLFNMLRFYARRLTGARS